MAQPGFEYPNTGHAQAHHDHEVVLDPGGVDHRQLVRAVAAGRVAIGLAMLVAPRTTARNWAGPGAADRSVSLLTRALGAREVALGGGTILALERGEPARRWVLAGVLSDSVDAVAALFALRSIGVRRALPTLAVATAAAAVGLSAADKID
jgi:hypothetical protein